MYVASSFRASSVSPVLASSSPLRRWTTVASRSSSATSAAIVGQIGAGVGIDELLADYPYLEREDIMQALRYAAWRFDEREVLLASA